MGVFLKFVLHLLANILWQRIGGKGGIPPVRLPKGKKPVVIPVVSPWQTVVVMWTARKMWAAFGGQFKDRLAASPHGAAQQVGSWLPNAPAKPQAVKPAASKAVAAKATPSAPAVASRAPQTWAGTALPAAPASPATPPATPRAAAPTAQAQAVPAATTMPAPRPASNYATRQIDDQDAAPAKAPDAPAPAAAAPSAPPPPAPAMVPSTQASNLRAGSLLSSLRRRS